MSIHQNPHVTRLLQEPGCLTTYRTWYACLVTMFLWVLWSLVATIAMPEYGLIMGLQLLLVVAPLGLFVPIIGAALAVAATAKSVKSNNFDILKLTYLTDRQLAWGYYYAALWRIRTFITTLVGLVVSIIVMLAIGFLVIKSIDPDSGARMALALYILTAGLQLIGFCFFLIATAVALAIRFRSAFSLQIIMPIVGAVLVIGGQILACVWLPTLNEGFSTWRYLQGILLAGIPFVLTIIALLLARKWVRYSE